VRRVGAVRGKADPLVMGSGSRGSPEGRDGDPAAAAVRGQRGGGGHGTAELCRALGARGWPSGEGPGAVPGPPG